jgi:type IV pilus secretin PilQ/predicted competence protein
MTRVRVTAAALAAAVAIATAGSLLLSAEDAPVKLLGVSSDGSTIVIEATEPVAYSVTKPDAWTLLIDLRNVTVDGALNQVTRTAAVTSVSLEQKSTVDGHELARVRLALARPAEPKVRSARNTIRVELLAARAPVETKARSAAIPAERSTAIATAPPAVPGAGEATVIDRVEARRLGEGVAITLGGNGQLVPASVTESRDLPRRLVLDFPGVTPKAPPQTPVAGGLVRQVRVAANSHQPLVTRVVMDLADGVTYHMQRAGENGRDLSIVFEPAQQNGVVMLAPGDTPGSPADNVPEPPLTIEQALANAASLTPTDVPAPDPFSALQIGTTQTQPAQTPKQAPTSKPAPAPARPAGSGAATQPTAKPAAQPTAQTTELAARSASQDIAQASAAQTAAPQKPAPQNPPAQAPMQQAPAVQPPPPATPTERTTQQQIVGAQEKKYTGHPITMDFQGVDLRSVLRTFAEISGLNMVIDPDVQGTVDMILTDVPWDQALEVILRGNNLDYTVDGSIVRVAKIDTLKKEQESRQQLAKVSADAGTLAVRTFTLSYGKAAAAAPLVKRAVLSPRGDVQIDERTNTLIITDLPARLDTVQQLLNTLDRAEPQVEVEARVVQTTREFAQAIGIQWGLNGRVAPELGNTPPIAFPNRGTLGGRTGAVQGPTGDPRAGVLETASNAVNLAVPGASSAIGLALGSINGAFNLDVALTALERSGKGRILSTPRLTTQNNIEAEVAQGIQIPIQTVANNTVTVSFKEAVLVLKVTPQITTAGTVIMRILVENATADFSRQVNGIPPIDTQRANTTVQVNDGSTTIIGGIFVSQEQYANERTPVLHRIPLLGWLFRRDSQTDQSRELLIFITPRILRG